MNIPLFELFPILRKEVDKRGVASMSSCEHVQNQPYIWVCEVVIIFQQCNVQNSVSKTQIAIISCIQLEYSKLIWLKEFQSASASVPLQITLFASQIKTPS
jgi:hypothetical protein